MALSPLESLAFMSHRYVNQLGDQEDVNEVYLAAEKQLRTNRNGNLYLQLTLMDKSGTANAMMWNATEATYKQFETGDYIHVEGNAQLYNGKVQVIVNHLRKARDGEVNEDDFISVSTQEVEVMQARIAELLRGLKNFHLRNLAEAYLMDETLMAKFAKAPAGIKNHHAYQSGLMEHVLNLMEVVHLVAPRYPEVDSELLLMGAFLHDMCKIDELLYERELSYSDEGQLIGHLVMAVSLLDEKVRESEKLSGDKFPPELVLRLKHMVVSHHGEYEYGSPKLPMTLEAVALHHLDNLDAKIHSFQQLMADDPNTDSNWTTYQPSLRRKLFKGGAASKS